MLWLQMHVAERQSIPNLPAAPDQAAGLPPVIAFDSLKSLPHRDYLQPHYQSQQHEAGTTPPLKLAFGLHSSLWARECFLRAGMGVFIILPGSQSTQLDC